MRPFAWTVTAPALAAHVQVKATVCSGHAACGQRGVLAAGSGRKRGNMRCRVARVVAQGWLMAEADSLGKRKSDLQVERQKLQMEIDYRHSLVVDENIICENLTEFTSLFDKLTFEERTELISLLFKEIRVSRFDPEKDELPCDPEAFVTKMRTAWYRVDLRMFSKSFNVKDMLKIGELEPKVRNNGKGGGEGGIRTPGTVSGTTDFESVPFGHSGTSPLGKIPKVDKQ